MKDIDIIEACSDLGINVEGAALGPKVLEKYVSTNNIYKIELENIKKEKDKENKKKNLKYINEFNEKLYDRVLETINQGRFPLTIGGDHSIAIASSLASIKKHKNLGIIWLDSHGDFNTFKTTITGNIHGLPLAAITGFEKQELTKFHEGNFYPYKNTVIVGARDVDELEMVNIKEAGITVFTTEDIKKYGAKNIVEKAISITSDGTEGIHISYDIDLIDPEVAPGVSVPAKNGINMNEVEEINKILIKNKELIKSMDLVEFNPLRDIDNKTEEIAKYILQCLFS